MATIDLSQLPAPNVVEPLDYETLFAERKATLISCTRPTNRKLLPELWRLNRSLSSSCFRKMRIGRYCYASALTMPPKR